MPGMELGIDLGTSQVVITAAGRGILLREPAVLAVDEASGRLIACGREAYAHAGTGPASIQVISRWPKASYPTTTSRNGCSNIWWAKSVRIRCSSLVRPSACRRP